MVEHIKTAMPKFEHKLAKTEEENKRETMQSCVCLSSVRCQCTADPRWCKAPFVWKEQNRQAGQWIWRHLPAFTSIVASIQELHTCLHLFGDSLPSLNSPTFTCLPRSSFSTITSSSANFAAEHEHHKRAQQRDFRDCSPSTISHCIERLQDNARHQIS